MKMRMQTIKNIRNSLMEQLKSRGADISLYVDVVDQYCLNLEMIRRFQKDIEERGIVVDGKDNSSIKYLLATQKQNTALIKSMELSTTKCVVEDDEL